MHPLRKAVGVVGLAGSVSLIALSAMALETTDGNPPLQMPESAVVSSETPPASAPVQEVSATEPEHLTVPDLPPAPVTITEDDLGPREAAPPREAASDVSVPEQPPAPVVLLTRSDWLRIAVTKLLADDAV